jgi:Tat protein secretion system quality control protein TatD with DNase activity
MTRDDIIKMAREAGFNPVSYTGANLELFERFAALVATAEREACAKVCEGLGVHPALNVFNGGPDWYKHGKDCAAAIRARGET